MNKKQIFLSEQQVLQVQDAIESAVVELRFSNPEQHQKLIEQLNAARSELLQCRADSQ